MKAGVQVVVLTDYGEFQRGRRQWHPGVSTGRVIARNTKHDRAWWVEVNGIWPGVLHRVILFEDEIKELSDAPQNDD